MLAELSIGRLAKAAEVSVETIRYYQRRGLLAEPVKPAGGQRRYPLEMVRRLCFIKRAQALGFTLAEIAGLLGLDQARACAETRALAVRKLTLIEQKMAELARMRQVLGRLVEQCGDEGAAACPIIEALAGGAGDQAPTASRA
ncbi:Hg(II)-responsive transcriptional regulator [Pseudomonas lalucatii]|uniref:Mercuric resistance operon regulatory protein n=1 Tax=Pseudomonas lalucatii TaxID=1424203 RepID=A0ABS5Q374_9PSED|nr:Hg(II)-responsive transcriptional regulator [Pseudomonas lalucatii]MBS7663207.1 Hg(II)-responsive transcriptional regulator [Pseudomonas lalucatii]